VKQLAVYVQDQITKGTGHSTLPCVGTSIRLTTHKEAEPRVASLTTKAEQTRAARFLRARTRNAVQREPIVSSIGCDSPVFEPTSRLCRGKSPLAPGWRNEFTLGEQRLEISGLSGEYIWKSPTTIRFQHSRQPRPSFSHRWERSKIPGFAGVELPISMILRPHGLLQRGRKVLTPHSAEPGFAVRPDRSFPHRS